MIAVLLGTEQDVRGFALAGVESRACGTAGEVAEAAAALHARSDVALILVSRNVARLAPDEVARLEGVSGPPALIVLPGEAA
ncbi:MAG: V-type ATP synthase subunit F [Myxococcales bacterium]